MNNYKKKNDRTEYFTAGELASMFDISKQSLLYYDRIGLLAPDFIEENGYRQYSIQQYLELEIIVNLRKLGLSISDIRSYLKNRSRDTLRELLHKRDEECRRIILENQKIRGSIRSINQKIRQEKSFYPEEFFLFKKEKRLLCINMLKDISNNKERIVLFAKASHKNIHNRSVLEKNPGWFINSTDFLENRETRAVGLFTLLPQNSTVLINQPDFLHSHKNMRFFTLPAGLYCETAFYGPFYEKANVLSRQLAFFLHQHKLLPKSDIYVQPIKNHWVTTNPSEYISRLFLKVNEE